MSPDGFSRPVLAFNGSLPGPLIRASAGDTLVVDIQNNADDLSAVHFHGFFQRGSTEMDGVPGVSQCPILVGETYRLTMPLDLNQFGTFWYHAHVEDQIIDGARGPVIIDNPKGDVHASLYTEDFVLVVSDWYHSLASGSDGLTAQYLETTGLDGEDPTPDATLINGIGQYNCTGSTCSYSSLSIPLGKTARVRLISAGIYVAYFFSIDGHQLTVIEVDGIDVEPKVVDFIHISPAQRYSFLVTASATTNGNFWIRTNLDQDDLYSGASKNPETLAIWIEGSAPGLPTTTASQNFTTTPIQTGMSTNDDCPPGTALCANDSPSDCKPYPARPPPTGNADQYIYVYIDYLEALDGYFYPHMNYNSYSVPDGNQTLLQLLLAGEPLPVSQGPVIIPSTNRVVDIIINSHDYGEHPMHLHGHAYWVLGYGEPNSGDYSASRDNPSLNFVDPMLRDTASILPYSWLYVRIVADNPGIWMLHCHIGWHLLAGFAMTIVEHPDQIVNRLGATTYIPKCWSDSHDTPARSCECTEATQPLPCVNMSQSFTAPDVLLLFFIIIFWWRVFPGV